MLNPRPLKNYKCMACSVVAYHLLLRQPTPSQILWLNLPITMLPIREETEDATEQIALIYTLSRKGSINSAQLEWNRLLIVFL